MLATRSASDTLWALLASTYGVRESHRLLFAAHCVREARVLNRVADLGFRHSKRYVTIWTLIVAQPAVGTTFVQQALPACIRVTVDSDVAGCGLLEVSNRYGSEEREARREDVLEFSDKC